MSADLVRVACDRCGSHRNEPDSGVKAACPVCGSWAASIVPPSLSERRHGLTKAPLVGSSPDRAADLLPFPHGPLIPPREHLRMARMTIR